MQRQLLLTTAAIAMLALPPATGAITVRLSYSSGTGFFVSRDGYVLTNDHVVTNCMDISVSGAVPQAPAVLVARSKEFDLALLKTHVTPPSVNPFNNMKQPLQAGDPVVIIGYPGQAWQTRKPVVRQASILSTKGPSGEEKWMEFSDALEKGNSGGPLLDASGNVVGVVVAKARSYVYNVTQQRQESERHFDLAISLPVVRTFLEDNDVQYQEADSGLFQQAHYMAQQAQRAIVNVRCKYDERVVADR